MVKSPIEQAIGEASLRRDIGIGVIIILNPVNNTVDSHVQCLPLKTLSFNGSVKINNAQVVAVNELAQLKTFG